MLINMIVGSVQNYAIVIADDHIKVTGNGIILKEKVQGLGGFLSRAKNIRLGWAELPDSEVIYIYDKGDDNFGYALNITDGQLSEWGYAPFPVEQPV